jgi:hypothetical protein
LIGEWIDKAALSLKKGRKKKMKLISDFKGGKTMQGDKLLIIGNDRQVADLMAKVCGGFSYFSEIKICSQNEGIIIFVHRKFTYVLLLEYSELKPELNPEPFNNWRMLRILSKSTKEKLVRCGHEKHQYPDYIKLPFEPMELKCLLLEE